MVGLTRILLGVAAACGLAYLVFFVPFGEKTIWGHLAGIAQTDEAKALGDGVKDKVHDVAKSISTRVEADTGPKAGEPLDEHSRRDRDALRALVREKNR